MKKTKEETQTLSLSDEGCFEQQQQNQDNFCCAECCCCSLTLRLCLLMLSDLL